MVVLRPRPGVAATVPTEETTPGVVAPSGSVTLTASPAFTSDCLGGIQGIVTTCRSEVADSTGPERRAAQAAGHLADPQRLAA